MVRNTGNVESRNIPYANDLSKREGQAQFFAPVVIPGAGDLPPNSNIETNFFRVFGREFGQVEDTPNRRYSTRYDMDLVLNPNFYGAVGYYNFHLKNELGQTLFNSDVPTTGGFAITRVGDEKELWAGPGREDIVQRIEDMGLSDDQFAVFPRFNVRIRYVDLFPLPFEGGNKVYTFDITRLLSNDFSRITFKTVLPTKSALFVRSIGGYKDFLFHQFE